MKEIKSPAQATFLHNIIAVKEIKSPAQATFLHNIIAVKEIKSPAQAAVKEIFLHKLNGSQLIVLVIINS